jgi:hypothetical protein
MKKTQNKKLEKIVLILDRITIFILVLLFVQQGIHFENLKMKYKFFNDQCNKKISFLTMEENEKRKIFQDHLRKRNENLNQTCETNKKDL